MAWFRRTRNRYLCQLLHESTSQYEVIKPQIVEMRTTSIVSYTISRIYSFEALGLGDLVIALSMIKLHIFALKHTTKTY